MTDTTEDGESPLLEARRQKDLPDQDVPDVYVLDPDGDIVRHLVSTGQAEHDSTWPGYHTDLYRFTLNGDEVGIIGCAVGSSFAVLVAEQLFAAGCEFLVSVTSSGRILPRDDPPYFVLILSQRGNPALPVREECSDVPSEPRTEQGGEERVRLVNLSTYICLVDSPTISAVTSRRYLTTRAI